MSRQPWAAAGCLLALIVLSGCSVFDPESDQGLERSPQPIGSQLPAAEADELRVPNTFDALPLVEIDWDIAPQELDGVFVAFRETDGALEFSAVAENGTVLWAAERPINCGGFALTTTTTGQHLRCHRWCCSRGTHRTESRARHPGNDASKHQKHAPKRQTPPPGQRAR
ncbi:hypothetical protein BSP109_02925 [Brevibacterium sp. Mu109]|nr:hypothetical protein BSP109_02925 [Brevibacterium sp. Mu109]